MKELLKFFETRFYTDLVSLLLAVIGLVISICKVNQNPKLKPLFFFFLGYVLTLSFAYFIAHDILLYRRYYMLALYIDFFDTIVEFLAFFFLIRNHIVSVEMRKILNPLLSIFLSLVFIYFIYYKIGHADINNYFLQGIFTIQASLLILACILYYIDLFKRTPDLNLSGLPSFWAVAGLSFFMLCTLPFSMLGFYLIKTNSRLYYQLFSIFNIFYCILFLMIIKAYFCKPETAKKY
jgi:hypothetical protein